MTRQLSVVIPVYFNAESLPLLFERLLDVEQQLNAQGVTMQLIFVDDGSKDNSLSVLHTLKEQRPTTTIIKLARNFGAVVAAKTGLQHATGDAATIIAADLQDPPELILQMAQQWQNGHKFVVCARSGREEAGIGRLFSYIYYRLLQWMVVSHYPDDGFDIMLVDRSVLVYLQNSAKNVNLQLLTFWLGHTPYIVEYVRPARLYGRSMWSYRKRIRFFLDSLLGFSILPVRIMSLLGLFVSAMSFTYGSIIFFNALLGRTEVAGFATLVTLITFLLGTIIVLLGIIGEYIVRIFEEVNKRPESVIDEVY